jgi:NAD(P)H-dependent FMN reductase
LNRRQSEAGPATIDLADHPLPHLDEAMPPMMGQYAHEPTKAWAATIARYDGFIFVTPEYNHSTSGVLKNAIDYLNREWNNKAAGFVSYGYSASGARAVEHLRLIVGELQIADVQAQVGVSLATDYDNLASGNAVPTLETNLTKMLDQVESWSGALQRVRAVAAV